MKTLNDFNFKNKKALIRVDFNVPLNEALEVTDTTRIEAVFSPSRLPDVFTRKLFIVSPIRTTDICCKISTCISFAVV